MGKSNWQKLLATQNEVRRTLQGIDNSVKRGTKQSLEVLAPVYLEETIQRSAGFNNYTGNLEGGYVATVISNGKKTKTFFHEVKGGDRSPIEHMPSGARKAKLAKRRHYTLVTYANPMYREHPKWYWGYDKFGNKKRIKELYPERYIGQPKSLTKQGQPAQYRYLKKNEREGGYKHLANKGAIKGATYRTGRSRSFIRIENVAPYSAAVQYSKRYRVRYNVLKNATTKWTKEGASLITVAILKELQANGFRAKK